MTELDSRDLPDFTKLREQAGWDYTLRNYVESRGSFELAVAFSKVFWPDFIERDGCVLMADGFDETNYLNWRTTTDGDIGAIERALNHVHLEDLVPNDATDIGLTVLPYLTQVVAEMWTARVKVAFPHRNFLVNVNIDAANGRFEVFLYQDIRAA